MSSINKATLMGHVGQEPKIITFDNGGKIANFSLATTEQWKDKTGQKQSSTEWHKIVIHNPNIIKLIEKGYIQKGSKVHLEGKIKAAKEYKDKEGNIRQGVEIVVNIGHEIQLLSSFQKSENIESNDNTIDDTIDDDMPF